MSAVKQIAEETSVEDLTFEQCTNAIHAVLCDVDDVDSQNYSMECLEEIAVRHHSQKMLIKKVTDAVIYHS